jgi:hypothetical protein
MAPQKPCELAVGEASMAQATVIVGGYVGVPYRVPRQLPIRSHRRIQRIHRRNVSPQQLNGFIYVLVPKHVSNHRVAVLQKMGSPSVLAL